MEEPNKNKRNRWLVFISMPFQMGAIIFLFSCLGNWLDKNHSSSKISYAIILVMVGVGLALYNIIRQVNQINKTE